MAGKAIENGSSSSWPSLFSPTSIVIFFWNSFNRLTFIFIFFLLICWSSMFIYLTFYFLYVPTISHTRNINFQFDSRCQEKCLDPYAEVPLQDFKTPSIFARGQSYRFIVDLDMPESDVNWNQGMFMVRLQLLDDKNNLVLDTATSSILRFKSPLLRIVNIICYWPWLVTGFTSESQHLDVPLKADYIDSTKPGSGSASKALVSIEAKHIQIYSAALTIKANLKGLRYFMVNWPLTSALFGTISIGSFLSIITVLSVYRVLSNQNSDIITEDYQDKPSSELESIDAPDPNSGLTGDIDVQHVGESANELHPDSTNPL